MTEQRRVETEEVEMTIPRNDYTVAQIENARHWTHFGNYTLDSGETMGAGTGVDDQGEWAFDVSAVTDDKVFEFYLTNLDEDFYLFMSLDEGSNWKRISQLQSYGPISCELSKLKVKAQATKTVMYDGMYRHINP